MSYIKIADDKLLTSKFIRLEIVHPLEGVKKGVTEVHKITRQPQMFPNWVAKYIRDEGTDANFTFTDETLS